MYEYCEAEGAEYTIGLVSNSRLEELAEPLLQWAKAEYPQSQQKMRLLAEFGYRAGSWGRNRRVVYKAEVMPEGSNTRFIATNKTYESEDLYSWYIGRGESEN